MIGIAPQRLAEADSGSLSEEVDHCGAAAESTRQRLETEVLRIAYQNSQWAAVATLIALPIVSVLIWRQSDSDLAWSWAAGVLAVTLLRGFYLRFAPEGSRDATGAGRLRRRYLLWSFAGGAAWGSAALLLTPGSLTGQVFLAFVLAGIAAVGVVIHAAIFSAVALFVIPAILPLTVRLFLEGTQPQTAMGLASTLFMCTLLAAALRVQKTSLHAIRLSLVNEELATYLRQAKQATDKLNSVLSTEVSERRHMEAKLRVERDFVSAILDTECGLVIVLDPGGRIVRFNRACETTTGYLAHELADRLIWDTLVLPEEEKYVRNKLDKVLSGQFPNECEIRWRRKYGGTRRVRLSNTALLDKAGRPTHIVATGVDVTDRHAAEQELARSREDFRLLVEGVSTYAIYMLDPDGRITSWNTGAEQITGYTAQEVIGTHYSRFYGVDDTEHSRPSIQLRMAASDERYEYEGWNVRKNGSRFWATVTVAPLRRSDNMLRGFSVITGDLTQRKQTEDTIRSLLSISEHLNASLDMDVLLDSLVQQSLKLLGASEGRSGIFRSGVFECLHYNRDCDKVSERLKQDLTQGLPGLTYRTKKPVRWNASLSVPSATAYLAAGIESAICSPILNYSGEAIGFIEVYNKQDDVCFSEADEERIVSVSQTASLAIQNALAFEQIKRTRNLLAEETRLLELIAVGAPLPTIIRELIKGIEAHIEDAATLFLRFDAENSTLIECVTARPDNWPKLTAGAPLPLDCMGERLSSTEAAAIHDITTSDAWKVVLGYGDPGEERCAWLCLIRTQMSGVLGILGVVLKRDEARHDEYLALVETCAHLAGIAIERRRAEEQLHESRERSRALSSHLQRVREEEKAHLARELHDELGSTLLALKIDTSWISRHLPEDDKVIKEKTSGMLALVDSAVSTTRRISSDLRPPMLDDLGLIATLEWQMQEFQSRTGIRCEFDMEGNSHALNSSQSIALFRIFQEAFSNIARHASASMIRVNVRITEDQATMEVEDNGRGIDPAKARRPNAHGVQGMFERIHSLQGTINLGSTPRRGTRLSVSIPLTKNNRH